MIQFNFKCLRELADFITAFDGILFSVHDGVFIDHGIKASLMRHLKEVEDESRSF
jgi:hypothetical protein